MIELILIIVFIYFVFFYGSDSTENIESGESGSMPDLGTALMGVVAVMMKADGNLTTAELAPVKDYLLKNFGEAKGKRLLKILQKHINENNTRDIRLYCLQINRMLAYSYKVELLCLLFKIAYATDSLSNEEVIVIKQYAKYTAISNADFIRISRIFAGKNDDWKNDYRGNGKQRSSWEDYKGSTSTSDDSVSSTDEAYKILNITSSATNDEVKSAYRKLAKQYHPDRQNGKSEKEINEASAKFRKINEAYKHICEIRNMK